MDVVLSSQLLSYVVSNINMACRNLLGLNNIHVLEFLNKFIQLLNCVLALVLHHSLDFFDLPIQSRTSHVEVLVSNFTEKDVLVSENEVRIFVVLLLKLLSDFLIWIYDRVGY
jgi:hypothetical protein